MKKVIKYVIFAALFLVALWFSFYTEPLSVRKEREALKQYKPEQLVEHYWSNGLQDLEANALDVASFVKALETDAQALREKSGRVLGIGSNVCYVVKGDAENVSFSENEFHFKMNGIEFTVPAKYIFGNTARDACGWFNIDDFQNTMDFNAVSACMNQRIKEQVIGEIIDKTAEISKFHFCGAIEVAPDAKGVSRLKLYPYILVPSETRANQSEQLQ